MSDHIWFLQARMSTLSKAYVPAVPTGLTEAEHRERQRKIHWRASTGQDVSPEELPDRYVWTRSGGATKLGNPLWISAFTHVHQRVVDVMQRFDIGRTIFRPITIETYSPKGINTEYAIFLTLNVRPTIDPERSEPLHPAQVNRHPLRADKGDVDQTVQAYRAALDGPEIWTDPKVNGTVFLSAPLAKALKAEIGRGVTVRKVQIAD